MTEILKILIAAELESRRLQKFKDDGIIKDFKVKSVDSNMAVTSSVRFYTVPEPVFVCGDLEVERWVNFFDVEWVEYDKCAPPEILRPVWIQTFQDHINLAWFADGLFYPYGGNINDGRKPFVDKFGDCDVVLWCYASLPEPKND